MTDGVLPNPSTNLQVSAGNGMNVLVEAGFALCNGCMAMEEVQRTLAVQASDTNYDRIDTVVLRLNDNDSVRTCDLYVLQGVAAAKPIRPSLTRTESIWEIGLADLFITPNSSAISNQRITDTRYETERCGIISAINEFDTTTLYDQIQADLTGFKEDEQAQFVEWFNYMKDQLSEDAAGNLQLQIDETNEKVGLLENLTTAVKTSIVGAINWLKEQIDTLNNNLANTNKTVSELNSDLSTHTGNKSNPHSVTKTQVGLDNVPNVNFLNPQEIVSSFSITDITSHEYKYKTTAGGLIFISVSCTTDLTNDYGSVTVDVVHGDVRLARDDSRTDVNSQSYRSASASAMFKSVGSNLIIGASSSIAGTKTLNIDIIAIGCTVTKI